MRPTLAPIHELGAGSPTGSQHLLSALPRTALRLLSKAPIHGTEPTSAEVTNSTGNSNPARGRRALLVSRRAIWERTCWPAFHQPGRVELRDSHLSPVSHPHRNHLPRPCRHAIPRCSPPVSFRLRPWLEHDGTARETELSRRSPRAAAPASPLPAPSATMNNLNLPIRSSPTSERNQQSRNYFTSYALPSSTEAINGPVREPIRDFAPIADRLIVGVDFGTTFSG